uniref:PH domain-containing protein n=1 Tax=Phytophthora ramorum TaxID=164328 RepID=H3HBQ9_PHYRM
MASAWRQHPHDPWDLPSPPPLLEEAAPKASKRSHFSRRSTRAQSQARAQAQQAELEVEALADQRDRDERRSLLAAMFGGRSKSRTSRSSSDAPQTLVQREKAFRLVGNFVKMGWLTKQGHMWKSWKTRFFVLFSDGTFAYYKNKGRKKIKGCMQLNDGVVSVQHVDVRVADKAYVFQIEKGFYKLLCYCCSQFEAELWVAALRSVRRVTPPCYETDLTATEEKAGSNAVTRHLNKIFITDKQIAKSLVQFKVNEHDHSYAAIHNFIVELDDAIIDGHHLELYQDPEIELLPGNDLVRLIRRHVEDRVFIPLYAEAYASLETDKVKTRRSNLEQNLKVLRRKTQADFGISKDLSVCDWKLAINVINMLECVSLPTHKFEVILSAGKAITESIAQYNGDLFEVSDETLTAVFRYVVTMASLSDLPILRALLKYGYQHHPACQNKANVVSAFLDGIKWVECFETGDESYQFDSLALAGSRVSVSISTNDVGIQFTTDGNGRGAIVYSVRKQSQAALSASIVPGLSLIAINHEPVIGMPFDKIIQRVRTAALPKQLIFMTEFYYYQLLSLDSEMFRYLMCIAARRGDLDSAAWLRSSTVELNKLCSWEKSRGKQVFGFIPVSGKGSPLHAAVHNGQLSMVKYLISRGADTNLCNQKGRRPLHVVKQSIDMALIIESLIDAGADIDVAEKHGLTPLMFMCFRASLEGAATLVALGADVRRVAWSNGFSALEFAVKSERTELVELCLSKGANPNMPTLDGNTSLHMAAALPHADIILRLLQSGANPNVQNRYGQTPATVLLASAPGGGGDARILCLEILTCAGCRLDKRDLFGRQASHLANISRDSHVMGLLRKLGSLNRAGNSVDVDIFGCSPVDYSHGIEVSKATEYFGSQMPNNSWEIIDKTDHVSRSALSGSVEDLIRKLVAGTEVDLVDVVAFVLFLDSFSSLNELVDRLSEHVRNGIKSHGLIRLFIMILLFRNTETKEVDDLSDRFYSLISHNIDVPREKLALSSYPTSPFRFICTERWAEQCTLLTHAVFCQIPVQDLILTGSKKQHSVEFTSIKRWFQHISAYVINAVLVQNSPEERAEVISFYLKLSAEAKKMMNEMQLLSDKGCREMNRLMRKTVNPSMPYIGLYLQGFVGLNELPAFGKEGQVNASRLRKMGELAMEILHRQSVAYTLQNDESIDKLLHVSMPYSSEESRYARSLEVEPREADAIPLSDRGSCVVVDDDLDLENEVRESVGGDGTFGFRQWIRKQQVVHRNRSRSSLIALYEWV